MIPYRLPHHLNMQNPNEDIVIYNGDFQLTNDQYSIDIYDALICICWGNGMQIRFKGNGDRLLHPDIGGYWEMAVNNNEIGRALITQYEDNKDVLSTAIHWYNQANINGVIFENAYISVFIGLELMYNVLIGKKADLKIKIESLSNLLCISNIESEKMADMRNFLTHYGEQNRAKYSKFDFESKMKYLQKVKLLLELSVLKYINYEGNYCDRTDGSEWVGESCKIVPWSQNK